MILGSKPIFFPAILLVVMVDHDVSHEHVDEIAANCHHSSRILNSRYFTKTIHDLPWFFPLFPFPMSVFLP